VAVVGGQADLWAPTAQDLPVTITAGRSSRLTPTFNRKGILNITLSDPKVVGDIFVDGAQVAGQVNAAQVPVAPNTPHVIEARALVNTAAPDAFEYDPVSSKVTVAANQTRAAPLRLGAPREKCTEGMAYMQIYNFIRVTLTLSFAGPEQFRVRVPASGNISVALSLVYMPSRRQRPASDSSLIRTIFAGKLLLSVLSRKRDSAKRELFSQSRGLQAASRVQVAARP
jgi:hypothetical protein